MKIHNIDATGSFTYNGVDLSNLTGSTTDSGSISTKIDNLNLATSSLNSFTSSINTTIKNKLNSESVISGSVQVLITGTTGYSDFSSSISSSIGSLSGSVATTTSGLASRITSVENKTGSYATTGSNIFVGSQIITGSICSNDSIVTTGQIVAQTINVQQVTSSIVYSCGSNTFGCSLTNTQLFTGSVIMTGSLTSYGQVTTEYPNSTLIIADSRPYAQCVGGKITLHGNYRAAGDITEGGHVRVSKTNGSDGDYGFDLIFANHTYPNNVSEKMRITSGGCVGVGTVTPEAALHVSTASSSLLKLTRTGATSANWTFVHGDGGGNGFLYFYNNSSDKNILTLRNDGYVELTNTASSLGNAADYLGRISLSNVSFK